MENRLLTGSLCLTEIVEKAKQGHSAFTKAANGKIYFNILQWLNSEPVSSVIINGSRPSNKFVLSLLAVAVWVSRSMLSDTVSSYSQPSR